MTPETPSNFPFPIFFSVLLWSLLVVFLQGTWKDLAKYILCGSYYTHGAPTRPPSSRGPVECLVQLDIRIQKILSEFESIAFAFQ